MALPLDIVNNIVMMNRPTYPYMRTLKRIQNSKKKLSIQDIVDISGINYYHDTYPRIIPRRVKLPYVKKMYFDFCEIRNFSKDRDFFEGLPEWFEYHKLRKRRIEAFKKGIPTWDARHPDYKPPAPCYAFRSQ